MKKQLIILLLLLVSAIAQATTYYVSSSGSDSNSGTSIATPFLTISKVNSLMLVAGDNVLFKCGESWNGTLNISKSGISGSPITYGSYGTGNNPMITGFTAVASWENLGNNIWESTSAVSTLSNCKMVLIDGAVVPMGRYPNYNSTDGGFLTFQSSTTTSITSSSLSGTPDWTGAEVIIRSKRWVLAKRAISSQSSGTLNFTTSTTILNNGYGFFIQNDVRTLDQQNEWYYNPTTKKIRIYSTYQPQNVKVASVENLVVFDKLSYNYSLAAHITIKNIDFVGSNGDLIYTQPSLVVGHRLHHVNISNCNLSYAGYNAIRANGDYMTMENNTFSDINGSGIINIGGRRIHLIRNNTFTNISMVYGQGNPDYTDMAISYSTFTSATIEGNRITNCGFNGISFNADSTVIVRNNYIENYNLRLDDGGAITTGGPNSYGCKIEGNICLNGGWGSASKGTTDTGTLSVGIYMDDNCSNVEVSNNTIANCYWIGIYLHNANTNNIHHNTVFNCRGAQIRTADDELGGNIYANTIQNNFFIAKQSTQTCASFNSNQNNLTTIGTLNGNIYSRPIDDNKTITIYQPSTGSLSKTLSEWKTFSSQDANSFASPKTISTDSDLYFYYNPTNHDSTVVLIQPGMDVTGQLYSSPITLSPYSSIVIIRDNSNGTYYYISSSSGSDSNAGTIDAPWQTLGKLNAFTHAANDRVLFKCGDSWFGEFRPRSGSASGRLIYSSYGTGAKPLIHNSYTDKTWALVSGNIWSTAVTVQTANVILNNTKCGVRKWSQATLTNQGDWFYDSANGLLKMYSYAIPTSVYSQIRVVNATNAITMYSKNYITIDGLALKYSGYGVVGSPVTNVTIQNCDVAWIGGQEYSNPVRKGNGIEFYYGCSNILVQNCKVWECFDAGITAQSMGNSYTLSNITFRNNRVWNCEYSFEYFNSGTSTTTSNFLIESNTCYNAGGGWGHNQRSDPSGYHIRIAEQPTSTTGFVIRNNIFSNSTAECLHTWATSYGNYLIDYNLFYQPSGNIVGINFATYYTQAQFSAYKSATGYDAHSVTGNPKFIGKDVGDFRLLPTSPARKIGYQGVDIGALPYTIPSKTIIKNGKIYAL